MEYVCERSKICKIGICRLNIFKRQRHKMPRGHISYTNILVYSTVRLLDHSQIINGQYMFVTLFEFPPFSSLFLIYIIIDITKYNRHYIYYLITYSDIRHYYRQIYKTIVSPNFLRFFSRIWQIVYKLFMSIVCQS